MKTKTKWLSALTFAILLSATGYVGAIGGRLLADYLQITEQAAPALSAASQAVMYADATSHTINQSVNGGAFVDTKTISATELTTGTLAAARGGTGVSNAGTITNATNTTILGGGTLDLAGFTLTAPGTGIIATLAQPNIFTSVQSMAALKVLDAGADHYITFDTATNEAADFTLTIPPLGGNKFIVAGDTTSTFVNGGGTIALGGNTLTVTGGGTLALGGFTATIPATGTVELLGTAQTRTAALTIATASASRTLTIDDSNANPVISLKANTAEQGTLQVETGAIELDASAGASAELRMNRYNASPFKVFHGTATPDFVVSATGTVAIGASGTAITKVLSASATLDFGNTIAQTTTDLTITVTGSAAGDPVFISIPTATGIGTFTAWVSAADTVTIRFANPNTVVALDPASGSFRATVFKF